MQNTWDKAYRLFLKKTRDIYKKGLKWNAVIPNPHFYPHLCFNFTFGAFDIQKF